MIERRRNLSREAFLEEYGRPGRPVIIEDATADWPAMRAWSVDAFAARYRDLAVRVSRNESPYRAGQPTTFGEYARYLRSHVDLRPLYLSSWAFQHDAPELLGDFHTPHAFADDWFGDLPEALRPCLTWLFIGPAGAGSWLHLDIALTAAWNVQVVGRKRWRLFDPADHGRMYGGKVDAFAPDLTRFPLFARARALECELGPGEAIFTPSRWWHQTLSLDEGIAVTSNYVDETNYEVVLEWLKGRRGFLLERGMGALPEALEGVVAARTGATTPASSPAR